MKKIIFLFVFILPLCTLAENGRTRNTIVSGTVSQTYFGLRDLKSSRLYLGLRAYPINSLSVGFYYSPYNSYGEIQDHKKRIYGVSFGLHAYSLFEIAGLKYFKDRVDLYGLVFFERENIEYWTHYELDKLTGEIIKKLDTPDIHKHFHKDIGIAIGCTYYIINNVGINTEYRIVTDRDWPNKYFRIGVSFRL